MVKKEETVEALPDGNLSGMPDFEFDIDVQEKHHIALEDRQPAKVWRQQSRMQLHLDGDLASAVLNLLISRGSWQQLAAW